MRFGNTKFAIDSFLCYQGNVLMRHISWKSSLFCKTINQEARSSRMRSCATSCDDASSCLLLLVRLVFTAVCRKTLVVVRIFSEKTFGYFRKKTLRRVSKQSYTLMYLVGFPVLAAVNTNVDNQNCCRTFCLLLPKDFPFHQFPKRRLPIGMIFMTMC